MTTINEAETGTTPEAKAERLATHLERLAAFVRANPDLGERFAGTFQRFLVCLVWQDNPRAQMADWARRGLAAGAKIEKEFGDKYTAVNLNFGPIELHVYAEREQVCERIVTGTREVEIEEPDPEAVAALPKIKRTEVVEDVEWRCHSILAGDDTPSVVSA
jgi:hypothetical protein